MPFIYRKAYETTKTGPNDASGVVWAIHKYFFLPTASGMFFFSIYVILYFTNEYLKIDYPGMETTRGRK